ncbi:hypothetical protein [Roseobacter sp. CCS2]|uniref:hypothetical protein n=1 Tax=Roseobacter sp. CCS2 TaxID=391593 RepID=UPI0000F40506|nr:hypothetical protein [Roseobacter sp. CCS2]EBA13088.1 hypothetical protein RCCS2_04364 [Roseobacter sp. CCS2]
MQGIMPPTLEVILATASSFSDETYEQLNTVIQKPTSTEPSDEDLRRLAEFAQITEAELRYFFSFLSFLFSQTADIPKAELRETLVSFVKEHGGEVEVERVAGKLELLLKHRQVQENAAKMTRLRDGLLPNVTGLANFVDLRSDFERDADGQLTGNLGAAVPIIQLGIQTSSSKPDEREFILQLDERTLDRLQEAVDDIREKLEILSRNDA